MESYRDEIAYLKKQHVRYTFSMNQSLINIENSLIRILAENDYTIGLEALLSNYTCLIKNYKSLSEWGQFLLLNDPNGFQDQNIKELFLLLCDTWFTEKNIRLEMARYDITAIEKEISSFFIGFLRENHIDFNSLHYKEFIY